MKIPALFLVAALLAGADCGDAAEQKNASDAPHDGRKGKKLIVRGSEFGAMLFDAKASTPSCSGLSSGAAAGAR